MWANDYAAIWRSLPALVELSEQLNHLCSKQTYLPESAALGIYYSFPIPLKVGGELTWAHGSLAASSDDLYIIVMHVIALLIFTIDRNEALLLTYLKFAVVL